MASSALLESGQQRVPRNFKKDRITGSQQISGSQEHVGIELL